MVLKAEPTLLPLLPSLKWGGDGRTHYGENQFLAAADCLSCLMEYCWYAVDAACCAISIGFAC